MTKAAGKGGRSGARSAGAKPAKKPAKNPSSGQTKPPARKPWGGRFDGATDPVVERFSASIDFDKALARQDIRGSRAQARMLGDVGLIPAKDARTLLRGLDLVEAEIERGEFPFDPALEDIHMNIETRLRTLVGPGAAGKLHTGRSRNDQVATDLALFLRDAGLATERGVHQLRAVRLERAREHVDTLLPGYTHLQRAQPVRLAHQWLAHVEVLGRDAGRFADARARIDRSPLGAGALAGSTLPLGREQTARELGFVGPTRNSMDTVASRDAALEYLAAAAIAMVHLSRLAEELVLWSTAEFGFVELADAYSTGSSLMPQKKNPDVPELVRGKSGRAIGNLVTLLTVLKGLPLTYNRDMQEDKEPLFDSVSTLRDSLEVMAGTIATLEVRRDRMAQAASDPMLLATDLAELLVRKGIPFREAHEVVGKIVGHCTRNRVDLRSLTRAELRSFHPAFDAGADELLDLERSVESRSLTGGTARVRVLEALDAAEANVARELARLADEDRAATSGTASSGRAPGTRSPARRKPGKRS
jgi:argininosuccinate lyase